MYSQIGQAIELIKNNEKIVLAGHTSPDGDAVSACFSLALAIEKMGKKPIILLEEYSENYNFLKGHNLVFKEYNEIPDIFIALDCGDISRLGKNELIFKNAKNTINIDHHLDNNYFANFNIVNKQGSSTSEIVFEIISKMDIKMDIDIANAIYTGIVFDTCGFKHNCTGKRTHQIAGELIEIGVDNSFIQTNLIYTHSLGNTKLLGKAIQNLEIFEDVAISYISKDEILKECMAKYEDIDGISSYLLDIKGIEIAIFLYEKQDNSIKASFRAKKFNVNAIAKKFGGGGHMLASGATFNTSFQEAKKCILEEIKLNRLS